MKKITPETSIKELALIVSEALENENVEAIFGASAVGCCKS